MSKSTIEVVAALRNTQKGQLKYCDRTDYKATKDFLNSLSPSRAVSQAMVVKLTNGYNSDGLDRHNAKTSSDLSETNTDGSDSIIVSSPVQFEYFNSLRRYLVVQKEISDVAQSVEVEIKEKVLKKRAEFESNDRRLVIQSKKDMDLIRVQIDNREGAKWQKLMACELQKTEDARLKQNRLQESHRRQAKEQIDRLEKVDQEMRFQENERLRRELEEQRKHLLAELNPLQADIEVSREQLRALMESASCRYPRHLHDSVNDSIEIMNRILSKMGSAISRAMRGDAGPSDVVMAQELAAEAHKIVESVDVHVAEANRRGDEELAAIAAADKQKANESLKAAARVQTAPASSAGSPVVSADAKLLPNSPTDVVQRFQNLQKRLEEMAAQCEPFLKDSSCSKDRFDLQKAVNTPVNAISPTTGAHLLDKLHRLLSLIAGQSVEIGGRQITARKHNVGVLFCKDLLAKKIVKQGDEQVSANHESAFAIASVAVGIWCEHQDVGELMLANFYQRCPYLAPYYIPQQGSESRDEYYRSLGYNVRDGEVEPQDKFLRRMSGIVRLYAAIIISALPPRSSIQRPHPHGLEHAWSWFSNVVNVEPRPDVTATILHDFLSVTGHAMHRTYGRQFVKLLRLLAAEYLPRVAAVTPAGASGPVTRLEATLKDAIAGRLPPPKGLIQSHFWSTS